MFIQATDGDLANVNGSITIENTQSPTSTAPTLSATENVKVDFDGITLTGHGPVGLELVKSWGSNVTFELLNMDNEESCTTKAEIVDGTMQITVNNDAPNGINVNFGPDYQNVVRVLIPDAIYTKFEIQSKEMVIQMQDFNAPVHVESNRAGFWLIDDRRLCRRWSAADGNCAVAYRQTLVGAWNIVRRNGHRNIKSPLSS